jgi:purine-binding chemotaxis protein CheW
MMKEKTRAPSFKPCQICTFWLAGRLYGVDILDVKEINTETSFAPIFHAPPAVRGYVNIRGQLHLVLDLKRILGCTAEKDNGGEKIMIFKPTVGEPFGVLVDQIGDIIEVEPSRIENTIKMLSSLEGENNNVAENLMSGICKLKDQLLVILNPREFLRFVSV